MKKYFLLLGLQQALAVALGFAVVLVCWLLKTFVIMEVSAPSDLIRFFGATGYVMFTVFSTFIFFVGGSYQDDKRRERVFEWLEQFSKSSKAPSQD